MAALDGNAIAGLLHQVFGRDMTAVNGVCVSCGATRPMAELTVYLRAPGTVVRCASCEDVVMVLVTIRGITCVDLRGVVEPEPAG